MSEANKVEEIRARLAKTDAKSYEIDIDEAAMYDAVIITRIVSPSRMRASNRDDYDIIEHAPDDVRYLLDEIARLTAERDEARGACVTAFNLLSVDSTSTPGVIDAWVALGDFIGALAMKIQTQVSPVTKVQRAVEVNTAAGEGE